MLEKTGKYFSEDSIEFLNFVEQVGNTSDRVMRALEACEEPDETDLSFLFTSFYCLT